MQIVDCSEKMIELDEKFAKNIKHLPMEDATKFEGKVRELKLL